MGIELDKLQTPKSKFQTKIKFQSSKQKNLSILCSWQFEFVWNLVFVIWTFLRKSLSVLIPFLAIVNVAFALPRFAILTGMQCKNCHVNPTGGELRNSFGSSDFVDDHLRLIPAHGNDYNFNPQINDNILVGGDVRFQYLYDGDTKNTSFQSMEGALYSAIHLDSSTSLFVRYDFVNIAYEAYGLYNFGSSDTYIKLGAFEPSYGIRLDDHTAYTRGGNFGFLQGIQQVGLIFYPDYRDLGIEVGTRLENFFITADVTNGDGSSNIDFSSKNALIGRVEYLVKGVINMMLGGSGYLTRTTTMYGAHAGLGFGSRISILGEYDWAKSLPSVLPADSKSNAAFVEVAYEITNGLFGVGRYDYFRSYAAGPQYMRYVLGVNIYPIPHLDFTPQVRFNTTNINGAPQPVEALIQSHIYF